MELKPNLRSRVLSEKRYVPNLPLKNLKALVPGLVLNRPLGDPGHRSLGDKPRTE
jgi:hypothetical protein